MMHVAWCKLNELTSVYLSSSVTINLCFIVRLTMQSHHTQQRNFKDESAVSLVTFQNDENRHWFRQSHASTFVSLHN
jgi:hypothetical protein